MAANTVPTSTSTRQPTTGTVAAAVEAAATASVQSAKRKDSWESVSVPGLVLNLHVVSRYAIIAAREHIIEPEVPVVWLEEKSREEANPMHPDYIEKMGEWRLATSIATIDTYIALGTSLKTLAEGMEGPESSEWAEKLAAAKLRIPGKDQPTARYLMWLKMWAITDDTEVRNLIRACQRFNGLTLEEDVKEAVDNFKSDEGRDSNTSNAGATESNTDKHPV